MAKKPSPTFDGGSIPPPPPGYTMVDASNIPPPPPGYTMQGEGTPAPPQEEPGMLSKIWGGLNKGLVSGDSMLNFAGKLGMKPEGINPGESTADFVKREAVPGQDPEHPYLNAAKVGLAGAVKDAYDTASSFTSPLSIGLMGAGALGKAPGAIGKAVRAAMPVVGGLFAGQGTKNAVEGGVDIAQNGVTPDNVQSLLYGGAGMAGGVAGMKGAWEGTKRAGVGLAQKLFVPGDPSDLMVRAVRPSVTRPDLDLAMANRMGQIYDQGERLGLPVNTLENYKAATDAAKTNAATTYSSILKPNASVMADTTPIANAINDSIPAFDKVTSPTVVARNAFIAKPFENSQMPLGDLDQIRQDTGAKLQDFWNKSGGDKWAARSNPDTARTEAAHQSTSNLLYGNLKNLTGMSPEPIQKSYGDLSEISDAANRRGVIYGRQVPVSLGEQIGMVSKGVRGWLEANALKNINSPDNLTKLAFERWASRNRVTPSWQRPIGTYAPGSLAASVAGANRR